MIPDVVTAAATATVQEVAGIIHKNRVGCVVIVEGERPLGIVTERTLLSILTKDSPHTVQTPIRKIMSRPLISVAPDKPYNEVMQIFLSRGIKRIPVTKNNRVIGLVTLPIMLNYSRNFMGRMLAQQKFLTHQLQRDPLTGIFNKRYFITMMKQEFGRISRYGGRACLLFIDLDHFKKINDTYSHSAGDYVLKKTAAILKSLTRKTDVLARYGGEEFCIITPFLRSRQAAFFGDKLRAAVKNHSFRYKEQSIHLTLSVGLTSFSSGKSYQEIIERADAALYYAKQTGRDRVCRWREKKFDMPVGKIEETGSP